MKIKLFGSLRREAGTAEKEASGTTLREALERICDDNQGLRTAIFDGDALRPHVRIMINGHDSELFNGLDTPVAEDDQIAVFPPIAGG